MIKKISISPPSQGQTSHIETSTKPAGRKPFVDRSIVKSKKVTVSFTEDEHAQLKEYSQTHGDSPETLTDLIRRCLVKEGAFTVH